MLTAKEAKEISENSWQTVVTELIRINAENGGRCIYISGNSNHLNEARAKELRSLGYDVVQAPHNRAWSVAW